MFATCKLNTVSAAILSLAHSVCTMGRLERFERKQQLRQWAWLDKLFKRWRRLSVKLPSLQEIRHRERACSVGQYLQSVYRRVLDKTELRNSCRWRVVVRRALAKLKGPHSGSNNLGSIDQACRTPASAVALAVALTGNDQHAQRRHINLRECSEVTCEISRGQVSINQLTYSQ